MNHRVRKVRPAGLISTLAGTGRPGFSGDGGPAVRSQLLFPNDVAADAAGNLYIADMGNNRIRRISPEGSTRAVALNQDGSPNAPADPAARGSTIVVFLTGQGPVNPAVPTGAAAPLTTLSHATLPVAANLGGRSAGLSFLGLAPGFAGLAQANVQIPPEVAPGNEVVLFLTVGGQASNTVHIAVK